MSVWRRKAMECLPEKKTEFEHPGTTIYGVFIELLPALVEAHKGDNTERLHKIYEFAEWCYKQKANDLWNAAGVSFYEHLYDCKETRDSFRKWIKRDIYKNVRGLLELHVNEDDLKLLDKCYHQVSNK
jgi:hypothetical protein